MISETAANMTAFKNAPDEDWTQIPDESWSDFDDLPPADKRSLLQYLVVFLKSLARLAYENLHDPDYWRYRDTYTNYKK